MASNEKHVCEICGCDEQPIVFHSGIYQHANLVECIIALKRQRKELRSLLQTAVDAWDCSIATDDVGVMWRDATLSRDWREQVRKVLDGKDGVA